MMNLMVRMSGVGTIMGLVAGFLIAPAMADVMKFHHDLPKDSAQHAAAEKFKKAVEERTKGEIEV